MIQHKMTMIVEPQSYRIDRHSPTSPDTYGVIEFEKGQPYEHVGALVPDGRLQAIADAWNKHFELASGRNVLRAMLHSEWPELADLLDALTKEKE